jgi:hypothetical protein
LRPDNRIACDCDECGRGYRETSLHARTNNGRDRAT